MVGISCFKTSIKKMGLNLRTRNVNIHNMRKLCMTDVVDGCFEVVLNKKLMIKNIERSVWEKETISIVFCIVQPYSGQ